MAKAAKTAPSRRPWTSDDVKTLKTMARKEPASQIAKTLKRTDGATRQKATALGLSLNTTRGRVSSARKSPVASSRKTAVKPAAKRGPAKKAPAKKAGRRA